MRVPSRGRRPCRGKGYRGSAGHRKEESAFVCARIALEAGAMQASTYVFV